MELLELRAQDNPCLEKWLQRSKKTDKCRHLLSSDVQNEILKGMSLEILRSLLDDICKSKYFSIICDGSQDINGQEQESVSIRYVNEDLQTQDRLMMVQVT